MAGAKVIDGKAIAAEVRRSVAEDVEKLKRETGVTPGLAVVLVGEDPASQVYVRNKARQTVETGMQSFEHKLPVTTSEAELLKQAPNPLSVYGSGHRPYYENVVKALAGEAAPGTDGREGRKSLELILGIYESARAEHGITLPLRTFARSEPRA